MSTRKMTNKEFGRRVGCDASMASYLRNGQRSPGTDTFVTIILTFELNPIEAMDAYRLGPEIFSRYLQATVFEYRTELTPDERAELGIPYRTDLSASEQAELGLR